MLASKIVEANFGEPILRRAASPVSVQRVYDVFGGTGPGHATQRAFRGRSCGFHMNGVNTAVDHPRRKAAEKLLIAGCRRIGRLLRTQAAGCDERPTRSRGASLAAQRNIIGGAALSALAGGRTEDGGANVDYPPYPTFSRTSDADINQGPAGRAGASEIIQSFSYISVSSTPLSLARDGASAESKFREKCFIRHKT